MDLQTVTEPAECFCGVAAVPQANHPPTLALSASHRHSFYFLRGSRWRVAFIALCARLLLLLLVTLSQYACVRKCVKSFSCAYANVQLSPNGGPPAVALVRQTQGINSSLEECTGDELGCLMAQSLNPRPMRCSPLALFQAAFCMQGAQTIRACMHACMGACVTRGRG